MITSGRSYGTLFLQDMTLEYDKKKATYDSCAAGLESNLSRLEQVQRRTILLETYVIVVRCYLNVRYTRK